MGEKAQHSRFGGSSASRWMNCAGSVALCAAVPNRSSRFADEGTDAHELAALALKNDQHPADWLGEKMSLGHEVTQEMVDAVVVYLNAVTHELAKTKDGELYVEQAFKIDVPSADDGEVFGTNDAMVYHRSTGRLVVFDYKHGQGVSVSAEDNAQLKFYAAGALLSNDWPVKELVLTIVQPRALDVDTNGAVREWVMDPVEVLEFVDAIDGAIARAKSSNKADPADLVTGPWCRWCDAAPFCPAKEREILEQAQLSFAGVAEITADNLPDPATIDVSRIGHVLKAGKLLNDWLGQIMEFVEAQLMAGNPVPGWKVVEKIGRAKWVADEQTVADELAMLWDIDSDLVRPRKLTTIGDVEKLLKAAGAKKDDIDSFKLKHTIKDSSGLTIAPDEDRRPAVDAVQRAFAGVDTDSFAEKA